MQPFFLGAYKYDQERADKKNLHAPNHAKWRRQVIERGIL